MANRKAKLVRCAKIPDLGEQALFFIPIGLLALPDELTLSLIYSAGIQVQNGSSCAGIRPACIRECKQAGGRRRQPHGPRARR